MSFTQDQIVDSLLDCEATIRGRYDRKLSMLGSRFDVDDLFQVTCMKAHQAQESCKAETPEQLRHWILTIAKNSFETAKTTHLGVQTRSLRREDCAIGVATDDSRDGYQPADDDAADSVEQHEDFLRATALVDRLPKQSQRILSMRYVDQLDYSEIAEREGMTENSVRLVVSRGLAKVRCEQSQPSLPGFDLMEV